MCDINFTTYMNVHGFACVSLHRKMLEENTHNAHEVYVYFNWGKNYLSRINLFLLYLSNFVIL